MSSAPAVTLKGARLVWKSYIFWMRWLRRLLHKKKDRRRESRSEVEEDVFSYTTLLLFADWSSRHIWQNCAWLEVPRKMDVGRTFDSYYVQFHVSRSVPGRQTPALPSFSPRSSLATCNDVYFIGRKGLRKASKPARARKGVARQKKANLFIHLLCVAPCLWRELNAIPIPIPIPRGNTFSGMIIYCVLFIILFGWESEIVVIKETDSSLLSCLQQMTL
jgi:hypothetical protein